MRLTRLPFAIIMLAAATAAAGQRPQSPASAIPLDARVRMGTLPNGLRYYVRKNVRPEKRVELRLVVNAGSVLEDADQRGLAHFVEHMLFNGTKRFKKNELLEYLESIGVRFGADLNAQTGFDETIYMLPVPTDKPELVSRAFDVLEDWAGGALFDSVDVAEERGVVLEEWRGGLGASARIRDQQLAVIFRGSRYAERLPIGLPETIRSATPGPLKRFYRDWYRPDLMAIVAVGDIDPAQIERTIRQRFAKLRGPAKPRPRAQPRVPSHKETLVSRVTDAEEEVTNLAVLYKHDAARVRTVPQYRQSFVEALYHYMFNERLGELTQQSSSPFSVASSGNSSFVRGLDTYQLVAIPKDERKVLASLATILTEAKRVREHGFLDSEMARAKAEILRAYESAFTEREKTESGRLVEQYIEHFLTGEPAPGIEWEYARVKEMLPTITVTEVNRLAQRWIAAENRVVTLSGPAKADSLLPNEGALVSAFSTVDAATVAAYSESVSSDALVPTLPAAGRIVAESTFRDLGVTQWRLANGIRVLVKPTDFKADEVLVRGWSAGGTSLVETADLPSAIIATLASERSGLGKFSNVELEKKLSGKRVSVAPYIDDTGEGVAGSASPKDLATLFELLYAKVAMPRTDSAAFNALSAQLRPFFANRGADPDQVFSDSISLTLTQHHPRAEPVSVRTLDRADYSKAMSIFRDRFADFSDYTFVIVGAVALPTLRPLVEQWLGALPATGRHENFRDVGIPWRTTALEKTVRKGTEPKAQTVLIFSGDATYSPQDRHAIRSLGEYVEMRLQANLREALAGTYSASAGGQIERIPTPRYTFSIAYGSAPDRADTLYRTVLAVIDSVRNGQIAPADIEKVREQQQRVLEVNLRQNQYWLSHLITRVDAEEPMVPPERYAEFVRNLNADTLRAAAVKYLDRARLARFTLLPEAKVP